MRTPRVLLDLRRRVGDRRALLRDGAGGGRRDDHRRSPPRSTTPRAAPAHRRGAARRAGGGPRRGLAGLRAGGLRQAERLPGAPAPPLLRPVGAQQDARAAGARPRHASGWAATSPSSRRPRSSTATTGWATRCSRPARPPGWRRSSTGSWPPSATRSPTSATSPRPGREPGDDDGLHVPARRGDHPRGLPLARRADRGLRGALAALDGRRRLVHRAGPVEVGGLPGGLLQAAARRAPPTTRSSSCSTRACPSSPIARGRWRAVAENDRYPGLLVDFGGVLTTNIFDSFRAFCEAEGIEPDDGARPLPRRPRRARPARRAGDRGAARRRSSPAGSPPSSAWPTRRPDRPALRGHAARRGDARARCAAPRRPACAPGWSPTPGATGATTAPRSPSSSTAWSSRARSACASPTPRSTSWAPGRSSLEPRACVFVDDLPGNLKPARELGMATVLHREAAETIPELEELLGAALR